MRFLRKLFDVQHGNPPPHFMLRRKAGPDQGKARKARGQAAFLIKVLAEDRPDDLRDAYQDALSRGPRWRERIEASLKRLPETEAILRALA